MYSFGSRSDTQCIDEPLYASYLARHPEVERAYRTEVLGAQDADGSRVIAGLVGREGGVTFVKHMSKHAAGLDLRPLFSDPGARHVLLFREPVRQIASFAENEATGPVTLEELGVSQLVSILSSVPTALRVDSEDLIANPRRELERVCDFSGIPFDSAMLSWEAGPKPFDGLWAPYWYETVHRSTGFLAGSRKKKKRRPLAPPLVELAKLAWPFYACLARREPTQSLLGLNDNLLVWVGPPGKGRLVPRDYASASVFDGCVQGGDACWEGLRVYRGRVFMLKAHLRRLLDSAKALCFENAHSRDEIRAALFETLAANNFFDAAHVRLTLTRGEKLTSSMNPKFNIYGTTLIVLAEKKPVVSPATYDNAEGVSLITAPQRRNPPQCLDSKIHHNNLLNNILAKLAANQCGASDAIMLDVDGFVSETNATNLFMVKANRVATPAPDHCLPGITRGLVIQLCDDLGIPCEIRRCSLAEFHAADEVFTTGTMGELTPVVQIDARTIGKGVPGPVVANLRHAFDLLTHRDDLSDPIDLQ
ncbi:hypothetical protein CTAYLR_009224 [Chrysophaeum taylorii]|uniref:Branched-chain-amino-acid aminotransferase n=1 Tax=Chrysophaeum taylorii TaxID=2483200 RepID=A0AAD7XJA6_9STRA|nr:hypothetical protein CTAYLR_009224 [Chrysophaeum taylorii]